MTISNDGSSDPHFVMNGDVTCLVWVATGGVLLLLAHLVKEGLKVISNLISTAITAVEAAVDRIVDAFAAFVDWMIDYICDMFSTLIAEPLNSMIEGFG